MSTVSEFPQTVTADAPDDKVELATTELLEKYDGRVPRYTSYPTAPHFSERHVGGLCLLAARPARRRAAVAVSARSVLRQPVLVLRL